MSDPTEPHDNDWHIELEQLILRHEELGARQDVASMTYIEKQGLYNYIKRLEGQK